MNQNHIGQTIKRLAKMNNVQVTQIAEHLNMTRSGVYDIFKRDNINDEHLLSKLAEIIGVQVSDLKDYTFSNKSSQNSTFGEDVADKFERIFQEWKAENEFLKEQIKEKDKLITLLMGKSEGCPIIADLELSLIQKIEMVYQNGLIFLIGEHKFGHTPTCR